MLAIGQTLSTLEGGGHLPAGFDAAHGLAQLYPGGHDARLSWLSGYLGAWYQNIDVTVPGSDLKITGRIDVGADGDGNWTFTGNFDASPYESENEFGWNIGFAFAYAPGGDGRGWKVAPDSEVPITANTLTFAAGGSDPWIKARWPRVLVLPNPAVIIMANLDFNTAPDDTLAEMAGLTSFTPLVGTGTDPHVMQ